MSRTCRILSFIGVGLPLVLFAVSCRKPPAHQASIPQQARAGGPAAVLADVGVIAEWHPARRVLVHTPGEELFLGVLYPEAALFENTFSIDKAAAEHTRFIELLRERGVRVDTVSETLRSVPRARLRDLAAAMTTLDVSRLRLADQQSQERYFETILEAMPPDVLVRMALQRPTIVLDYAGAKPGDDRDLVAEYKLNPLMNMYFTRDHMITTSRGVVLGRMAKQQRRNEKAIIKVVLEQLGIRPILEIRDGTLEGGDFMPAGDHVFIGQGARTDRTAIATLLKNNVFDGRTVIVVKDTWLAQQEMHLDTYFNMIDSDLAVLVEDRFDCVARPGQKCQTADIWIWEGDHYRLDASDLPFAPLLRDMGVRLIPVSVPDQEAYGVNFLTVGKRSIIGVDGVSRAYKQALQDHGVKAEWVDFSNLKLGYGGAHCTTQVLDREPPRVTRPH